MKEEYATDYADENPRNPCNPRLTLPSKIVEQELRLQPHGFSLCLHATYCRRSGVTRRNWSDESDTSERTSQPPDNASRLQRAAHPTGCYRSRRPSNPYGLPGRSLHRDSARQPAQPRPALRCKSCPGRHSQIEM